MLLVWWASVCGEGSSAQPASWKGAGKDQHTLPHGTVVVTPAPG
jgi:hypothetical protein